MLIKLVTIITSSLALCAAFTAPAGADTVDKLDKFAASVEKQASLAAEGVISEKAYDKTKTVLSNSLSDTISDLTNLLDFDTPIETALPSASSSTSGGTSWSERQAAQHLEELSSWQNKYEYYLARARAWKNNIAEVEPEEQSNIVSIRRFTASIGIPDQEKRFAAALNKLSPDKRRAVIDVMNDYVKTIDGN